LNYHSRINVEKYEYFIDAREEKIWNYHYFLYIIHQFPL
jgi:hypothetical protein